MSALTKTSLGPASFSTGSKQQLLLALNTWLGHCKNNDASITTNRLVGFINPHVFNLSFEHNVVLDFLNQTHAACVDGVGVKLALFARTGKLFPRVVAEHLFESFLHSLSFPVDAILIGGEPGAAARPWNARSPGRTLGHDVEREFRRRIRGNHRDPRSLPQCHRENAAGRQGDSVFPHRAGTNDVTGIGNGAYRR